MDEKKVELTDEEIVKALKVVGKETLAFAYDKEQRRFKYVTAKEILDLIHRLQDDYSKLKERYIKVLDLNEKVIAEQKAEIERLKDEFKTDYRNSWKNKFFGVLEENQELQKQVDEKGKKTAREICGMLDVLDASYKQKVLALSKLKEWIKKNYDLEVK